MAPSSLSICFPTGDTPEMSTFDKIKKRIMEYKEIFYIIVGLAVIEAIILIIKFVKWIKKKSVKR